MPEVCYVRRSGAVTSFLPFHAPSLSLISLASPRQQTLAYKYFNSSRPPIYSSKEQQLLPSKSCSQNSTFLSCSLQPHLSTAPCLDNEASLVFKSNPYSRSTSAQLHSPRWPLQPPSSASESCQRSCRCRSGHTQQRQTVPSSSRTPSSLASNLAPIFCLVFSATRTLTGWVPRLWWD